MSHSKQFTLITLFFIGGCSTSIPYEEREEMRQSIDEETELLVEELANTYPEIHSQIEDAEGYASGVMSNLKVPLIGGGTGVGAVYDNSSDTTTYIDIHRYDLGAGLGASSYRVISILETEQDLERFNEGFSEPMWGTDWNISTSGIEQEQVYSLPDSEFPTYVIFESSASAVGSARLLSVSVNDELTETGLGDAKVASHTASNEAASAKWDRPLPLFAQDVVDQGFSLPLPFGVSIIYADTYQQMSITELEAGIGKIGTVPIESITFDNNYSHSQSPQLKIDAWVFPFMNVFATVGKVNGMAHVEFASDGSVSSEVGGLICRLPGPSRPDFCDGWNAALDVDLDGWNYTLGTVLAAGWGDYFLAIPANVTYVDMKNAKAEELVVSVSPRIGKQFQLKDAMSLDLYVGASYLDSTLTIKGQHKIKADVGPFQGEDINYKIKQENLHKWTGLVGASYNFNRSWALQAEYGQNGSDKRQFVSSLTHRF